MAGTQLGSRIAGRFGEWTLLYSPLELLRDGERVRLQEQPLRILEALLSRPGELVSREELVKRLWPRGVVDFDAGLNTAMRKLRSILEDDAEAPRYVETVPRQGYRFIGEFEPGPDPNPHRSRNSRWHLHRHTRLHPAGRRSLHRLLRMHARRCRAAPESLKTPHSAGHAGWRWPRRHCRRWAWASGRWVSGTRLVSRKRASFGNAA